MKRRADGRWMKKITLPNGKFKYLFSSAPTERLAVKEFNEKMLNLKMEDEQSQLFEFVAEQWKDKHFPGLENNSLKQYRPGYNDAVEFFKGMPIAEIKASHVADYMDEFTKKGYAKKTIKNRISVLNLIFKHAILYNGIKYSPCPQISLPKNLHQNKRQPATPEDIEKIINNTDSLCGVLAYLYLTTGCRRGEGVALTPNDVDLDGGFIRITKTVEWEGGTKIKNHPKTNAGFRNIPINTKLVNLLKPYMRQKYIFQNYKGALFDDSQLTRMWNGYKKEIGITCTPHQLRHSYATTLFDADIDIKTAQLWLGHEDINTTLGIYTHLSEKRLQKTTDKIHEYLNSNF